MGVNSWCSLGASKCCVMRWDGTHIIPGVISQGMQVFWCGMRTVGQDGMV